MVKSTYHGVTLAFFGECLHTLIGQEEALTWHFIRGSVLIRPIAFDASIDIFLREDHDSFILIKKHSMCTLALAAIAYLPNNTSRESPLKKD